MNIKGRKRLRILSFNWHEPYLCMLAATGHQLLIIEPIMSENLPRKWNESMRPLPENVSLIGFGEMAKNLDAGDIDLVICQNVKDLVAVNKWEKTPKILVFHNKLTTEIALGKSEIDRKSYIEQVKNAAKGADLVFISQAKKDDWNLGGGGDAVILPGIDVSHYGGYTGNLEAILTVGNHLKERDLMMGFTEMEEICRGLPVTILGDNPSIDGRLSKNWDDLKNHYRQCRLYLNTLKNPYEDGYNLALLEAMATGMPVISLKNPTSPVTDGAEGFVSSDISVLRDRINELLKDPQKALKMGRVARQTVSEKFPMEEFLKKWNDVIGNAVSKNKKTVLLETHTVSQILTRPKPARIWMDYTYYPATTAHYLRRAFEAENRVVTSGSSITPEIIKIWNLEKMKAPIVPQDIPRTKAQNAFSIIAEMPKGFKPEFFFWVDTGIEGPPHGIEKLPFKKAAYLIDTHINTEKHLQMAAMFDVVFLAQREYVDMFKQRGIRSVHWLPLACDPEIHGKRETKKKFDIGFVGSITPAHARRKALLEKLASKFKVEVSRLFLEEMAEHFSASKIVFNNAIKNDLNMRVFEALCSGSLLLTDAADGLSDFFEDGKHLVVFNDGNITELAGRYLENEKEREMIASEGRKEVLKRHTYFHRAQKIIETMRAEKDSITIDTDQSYYHHVRPEIMEMAPENAKRILDVGCAAGEVGARLKEMNPEREVVGVEFNPKAAENAAKLLDRVFVGDIERLDLPYDDGYFDCIIYADVLEHLHEPEKVIMKHKRLLAPSGVMLMSIPNTRHYSLVNHLIEGRWTYIDQGLLDRTHLRFFTLYEIRRMLARCGLKSIEIKGKQIDDLYKDGASGLLRIGRWQIDNLTPEEMTEFFVFQYIIMAMPDPHAVLDKDVTVPEYFHELIKSDNRFKGGASDAPDTISGLGGRVVECTDHTEAEELAKEIDSIMEAGAFAGKGGKLWAGHFNMALSRFDEAEKIYRDIGDMKFVGCALAARGLMMEALSCWWEARNDSDAENWLLRYSSGKLAPERVALKAAREGSGICLEAGKHPPLGKNLDFITSLHALGNADDIVKTIAEWRKALRPGGVLALVCAHAHAQPHDVQPTPMHRFTHEGLNSLIELAGGFVSLCTKDIYKDRSFVAVYQKKESKKGGRKKFDFDKRFKVLLSETAYKKSLEYWETNNLHACMQAAEAAITLNPKNGEAVTKLGDCLMKQGKVQEASFQYQLAIKVSKSEAPHIGMGTIYLSAQDLKSAQREFKKAVKLNPENDRAVCGLGMAYFHAGKKEEGFNEYEKALEINPENGTALNALLQASYAMNKLDEAENALEKFLELHPANLDVLFGLAGVFYATQKFTQAKDVLERILALSPENADATALYEKTLKEEIHTKK